MKNKDLCYCIIDLVGGKENIEAVVHCMTRLRFTLKNRDLADANAIKDLDEVIDVVSNNISFQIIIGTEVTQIHPELIKILGMVSAEKSQASKNPIKGALNILSEAITPMLPAFLVAGMLVGLLSVLKLAGVLDPESSTYIILDSLRSSMFYFLPVFAAVSVSKRLGAPLYLGILLAVTTLSTSINGVEGLNLFGINLPTITYSSTFLPIILGLWFMGKVYPLVTKYMPKALQFFFTPLVTMLIVLPVTLFVFGPSGTWIGNGLSIGATYLNNTIGAWSVIVLYVSFQPCLIMLGAGSFVIPLSMNFFATLGYDPIVVPGFILSDLSVCAAMLGYFLRAKDKKQKQFFGSVSFSAFMGITEPAVFGAFVKYRRPFFAVAIGGGLGGLFAGLMHVKGYVFTPLFGILSFIGENDYKNFYCMVGALVIAFVGSATAGYLLWLPKDEVEKEIKKVDNHNQKKVLNKSNLAYPVNGTIIPLEEVNDKAFSTGALGKGVGIIPNDNIITSPISGEVVTVFSTKHAIGIKNDDGIEVLIHIGIDTVDLNGQHFQVNIEAGDKVSIGDKIAVVDFEKIREKGYDPTVIMVVTNTADYLDVIPNIMDSSNQALVTVVM